MEPLLVPMRRNIVDYRSDRDRCYGFVSLLYDEGPTEHRDLYTFLHICV